MSKVPEKIWLQWNDPDFDEGVTWCRDKINNEDEQYTHTQQLIEKLDNHFRRDVCEEMYCGDEQLWREQEISVDAHNQAIDEVIKMLRGQE